MTKTTCSISQAGNGSQHALVVGAGPIGRLVACHLERAGLSVSLWVKPQQRSHASGASTIGVLGLLGSIDFRHTRPQPVYAETSELPDTPVDLLVLTVSAPALGEEWLEQLASKLDPRAIVAFQPGADALATLRRLFSPERVVFGLLGLCAYRPSQLTADSPQGPTTPDLVHCFFVPGAPTRFVGHHAEDVVRALRKGGFPAKVDPTTEQRAVASSAILLSLMATWETVNWERGLFLKRATLRRGVAAAKECLAVAGASGATGTLQLWLKRRLLFPTLVGLSFRAAFVLLPFDAAGFFVSHFRKLRRQTHLWVDEQRALAGAHGLPSPTLTVLAATLSKPRDDLP